MPATDPILATLRKLIPVVVILPQSKLFLGKRRLQVFRDGSENKSLSPFWLGGDLYGAGSSWKAALGIEKTNWNLKLQLLCLGHP